MSHDLDFMNNLSAAILARQRRESRFLLYAITVSALWLVVWARFAEIDQITRGMGRIVPTSKVQVVQNLEGGIVSEILVKAGDTVEKDQAILKIENKSFESNLSESGMKLDELSVRRSRLAAEAADAEFKVEATFEVERPELVRSERLLFESDRGVRDNQMAIIAQQIDQKRNEVADAQQRVVSMRGNLALLDKQLGMTRALVERGIESKTEYLRLERERLSIKENLESAQLLNTRHQSAISELEKKIQDLKISFSTRAQKELNETVAMMAQIAEKRLALKDQVVRTHVRSPVRGIVKQLSVHTVGGVVKPGADLVEIVPLDDTLLVEAKIKPSDIAFIKPGQRVSVKVSAYDFSIFGGLTGEVQQISADTLTEQNGATYYLVSVSTTRNTLGTTEKPLQILPGMQVTVDILTGKRTVLDYLLKPIMKARQNAMTER